MPVDVIFSSQLLADVALEEETKQDDLLITKQIKTKWRLKFKFYNS